ncbi:MAG: HU family DNA-binding protein [Muribaculaceae bacterium]|jgi:nucleoid DNA-binding protein/nucleoid-associated protein YgaU|nr:HU family DNA-binding protein [Muribaculaceae bacterium]
MNTKITLPELVEALSNTTHTTKRVCEAFLKTLFSTIGDTLVAGDNVKVKNIGSFKLINVEARKSVNVNTGEEIEIPSHAKITFTPDKIIAEAINRPFANFEACVLSDDLDEKELERLASTETEEDEEEEQTDNAAPTTDNVAPTTASVAPIVITPPPFNPPTPIQNTDEQISDTVTENPVEKEEPQPVEPVEQEPIAPTPAEIPAEKETEQPAEPIAPPVEPISQPAEPVAPPVEPISQPVEPAAQPIEAPIIIPSTPIVVPPAVEPPAEAEPSAQPIEAAEPEPVQPQEPITPAPTPATTEQPQPTVEETTPEPEREIKPGVRVVKNTYSDDDESAPEEEPTRPRKRRRFDDEDADDRPRRHRSPYDEFKSTEYGRNRHSFGIGFVWGFIFALVMCGVGAYCLYIYNKDGWTSGNGPKAAVADSIANKPAVPVDSVIGNPDEEMDSAANMPDDKVASNKVVYDTITSQKFLTRLAGKYYGNRVFWVYIYEENKSKIKNPNNVRPGTVVVIPSAAKYGIDKNNKESVAKAKRKEAEIYGKLQ